MKNRATFPVTSEPQLPLRRAASIYCRAHDRPRRYGASILAFLVLQTLVLLVACTSTQTVGTRSVTLLGPGVINDPKNKSLRFDILKFGLQSFCNEMLSQGIALRLSSDHPVAGRFFGKACQADVIDDDTRRDFTVKFSGVGYVWTNLTGRVGIDVLGAVELLPDFQLAPDSSMYVYFRTNKVDITQLKVTLVESNLARSTAVLANADPEKIGREIIDAQLKRGFTVIRLDASGQTEFGPGLLNLGEHPYHPFKVQSESPTLANERTEVHRNQQDFIGAFKVEGDNHALGLAISVDGAPGVTVSVISAAQGQQLIDRYVHVPGIVTPTEPARYVQNVSFGSLFRQTIPVPEGSYYLVLQHLPNQGAPPNSTAGDDRAAKVDYLVQLVNAP